MQKKPEPKPEPKPDDAPKDSGLPQQPPKEWFTDEEFEQWLRRQGR